MPENIKQDIEDIKSSLSVELIPGKTYLVAIAKHADPSKNRNHHVKLSKTHSFTEGYAYDQQNDSYIVQCIDQLAIGFVPVAFVAKMPEACDWHVQVPLPDNVISRYLTPVQHAALGEFKKRFASDGYIVQLIQMAGIDH